MSDQVCPCGRGNYVSCCKPLHVGEAKAVTAEQLMRSRYSAFALHNSDYIVNTTALGQQQALDQQAILDWAKSNQWLKLEIVQAQEKVDKNHARVEFKAHSRSDYRSADHHETSLYLWFK